MIKTYDTVAFAKINLFLKVCGKYPNGYHRLLMLMQEIGIGDEIKVSFDSERDFAIELDYSEDGIEVTKNLCYKAADAFYDRLTRKRILDGFKNPDSDFEYTFVKTVKNTPSQAGLGGGSSDAAAILMILQQHYGNPFTYDELNAIATGLGADVPFFLTGGTAICEGIGEKVSELPSLSDMPMVLVKPPVGVPTGQCFNLCDSYAVPFDDEEYRKMLVGYFEDDSIEPVERLKNASGFLTNDLEVPAIEIVPRIAEIKNALLETKPLFTMMSGSGSSVYAFYENEKAASEAHDLMKSRAEFEDCFIINTITI